MKVAKILEGKEANTRWGQDDWRPNRDFPGYSRAARSERTIRNLGDPP